MSAEHFIFFLKDTEIRIPINPKLLGNCDDRVSLPLIKDQKYQIQADVTEENCRAFIKFWAEKEKPNITSDNYYDFYILNQEFKIDFIDEFLESKKEYFDEYEKNIIKLKDKSINDKSMIEQLTSKNLDIYLYRYPNELMALPIQQLHRIFGSSHLQLRNHILAYQKIINQYQESNNLDIFTLLPYLDGNELSKEIVDECFQKREERGNFLPKFNSSSIEAKLSEKDAKISELENQITIIQSKLDNLFSLFIDNQHIINLSRFYLPIGKNWIQVNINEFTFSENATTYTLKSSSTFEDSGNYPVINLLDDKNEQNLNVWASNYCQTAFIEISFSSPICINLISLTARNNEYYTEAPSSFDILAKNEGENDFVLLKSFVVFMWKANERKVFPFINTQTFSSYKLIFNSCAYKHSKDNCYGLAEFNLGFANL